MPAYLNRLMVEFLPAVPEPILWKFSKKYIAGPRLEHAVECVRSLNLEGCAGTIDILGEFTQEEKVCRAYVLQYKEVLQAIRDEKLDCNISVKLTAIGLKIGRAFCEENLRGILENARAAGNFVRIDMEDSGCTDDTLAIYESLRRDFPREVGVAVQAYLRRTVADTARLQGPLGNFRLCKGIYIEPREIAYRDREIVRRNFALVLEMMLRSGSYVGIATHDEILAWEGLRLVHGLGLGRSQYEFQMLLGVDETLRKILVRGGHRVRVYVPYGEQWRGYSIRRLKENPEVLGYALRSLLRQA